MVVVAHGLGEDSLRYRRVAEALAPVGFDVVAVDHRRHGATTHRDEEPGSFGPGGFGAVVDDFGLRQSLERKCPSGLGCTGTQSVWRADAY